MRDDERFGRSREGRTPELVGKIRNFMDEDRRVSIETISTKFDVSVGTVHTIIHEQLKMRKNRRKDVITTAGRWSSLLIQIPKFLRPW